MKTALKLGVTEKEIERLCDAVLKALDGGPLDPDGIREATGKASRSLGESFATVQTAKITVAITAP